MLVCIFYAQFAVLIFVMATALAQAKQHAWTDTRLKDPPKSSVSAPDRSLCTGPRDKAHHAQRAACQTRPNRPPHFCIGPHVGCYCAGIRDISLSTTLPGWGGRDRTSEWGNQNPLPYRLATPQQALGNAARRLAPRIPRQRRSIGGVQSFQQPIGQIYRSTGPGASYP